MACRPPRAAAPQALYHRVRSVTARARSRKACCETTAPRHARIQCEVGAQNAVTTCSHCNSSVCLTFHVIFWHFNHYLKEICFPIRFQGATISEITCASPLSHTHTHTHNSFSVAGASMSCQFLLISMSVAHGEYAGPM